jgi:hypothetical protein
VYTTRWVTQLKHTIPLKPNSEIMDPKEACII